VDYIKIDGGFIIAILCDGDSNVVFVRALNDVARGLSKQVIADGVETAQALKILLDMGAQYGQAFYSVSPIRWRGPPIQADSNSPLSPDLPAAASPGAGDDFLGDQQRDLGFRFDDTTAAHPAQGFSERQHEHVG